MQLSIRSSTITILFALFIVFPSAAAQHSDATNHPITQAVALKLGPGQLTRFVDSSEAAQDYAAQLYATAKRLETEQALARRDLELVPQLDEWRQALGKCRVGSWELAGWVHGGGTLWYHSGARDCTDQEEFLADLAKRLPLAEGKGSLTAAKQIDTAIAFMKKVQPYNDSKEYRAVVRKVTKDWEHLKVLIRDIPASEARKIASFAIASLDCLKEGIGH